MLVKTGADADVVEGGAGVVEAGDDGVAILLEVVRLALDAVDLNGREVGAEFLEDLAEADDVIEALLLLCRVRHVDADIARGDRKLVSFEKRLERAPIVPVFEDFGKCLEAVIAESSDVLDGGLEGGERFGSAREGSPSDAGVADLQVARRRCAQRGGACKSEVKSRREIVIGPSDIVAYDATQSVFSVGESYQGRAESSRVSVKEARPELTAQQLTHIYAIPFLPAPRSDVIGREGTGRRQDCGWRSRRRDSTGRRVRSGEEPRICGPRWRGWPRRSCERRRCSGRGQGLG